MPLSNCKTSCELEKLIENYFTYIEGEYYLDEQPEKMQAATNKKIWDREPEPATIAGLTFYLGFNDRQAFDDYCANGEFANTLNRSRLRIEASYEKKLHNQSATGAIFALKSMGWNEKQEQKPENGDIFKTLIIELIESGPDTASNEKDVII